MNNASLPQLPPILVRRHRLGDGRTPLVCTPVVARGEAAILGQVERVVSRGPDLLEWRIDHFERAPDPDSVIALAQSIRERSPDIPLLATLRSPQEGGALAELDPAAAVRLYTAMADAEVVDLVDFELSNEEADFARVREATERRGVALVASFHDFALTPSAETLLGIVELAVRRRADVAKIAVMPENPTDVLTLLEVTEQARQRFDIPLITISMGPCGAVSRAIGWMFGSQVSFAVGESSSAPGQLAIDDLKAVVGILKRGFESA